MYTLKSGNKKKKINFVVSIYFVYIHICMYVNIYNLFLKKK